MAISIHALLAESDPSLNIRLSGRYHFYPRSPCGERLYLIVFPIRGALFLSTLSLRRATQKARPNCQSEQDFYPRSPCGERLWVWMGGLSCNEYFYPRSPCGERRAKSGQQRSQNNFYPRSPCGERLRKGTTSRINVNFYPRSPCGERQHGYQLVLWVLRFLSTLSLRRATFDTLSALASKEFLSTLSLRRATVSSMLYDTTSLIFLSTLSLRRATVWVLPS